MTNTEHLTETLTARADILETVSAEFRAYAADPRYPSAAWGWTVAADTTAADARECRALVRELEARSKPAPCSCGAFLGTLCAAECSAWIVLAALDAADRRRLAADLLAVTVGPR